MNNYQWKIVLRFMKLVLDMLFDISCNNYTKGNEYKEEMFKKKLFLIRDIGNEMKKFSDIKESKNKYMEEIISYHERMLGIDEIE